MPGQSAGSRQPSLFTTWLRLFNIKIHTHFDQRESLGGKKQNGAQKYTAQTAKQQGQNALKKHIKIKNNNNFRKIKETKKKNKHGNKHKPKP